MVKYVARTIVAFAGLKGFETKPTQLMSACVESKHPINTEMSPSCNCISLLQKHHR